MAVVLQIIKLNLQQKVTMIAVTEMNVGVESKWQIILNHKSY